MNPYQRHVNDALRAGMPQDSAERWGRYLAMKDRNGEKPITLQEAVEQLIAVGRMK